MLEKTKIKLPLIIAGIVFIVLGTCLALFMNYQYKLSQLRFRYIADNQVNYIISCVDKIIMRSEIIKEAVIGQNGQTTAFNRIAPQLLKDVKTDTNVSLRNIALAPNCIISDVFPLGTNEAVLGFNYADTSKSGNLEAIQAWRQDRVILTNPYNLIQGGKGISVRVPIFLKTHHHKDLWGLVSITIDIEDLISSFKLSTFSDMGINYELWYTDDKGYRVSLGASEKLPSEPITMPFMVKNLSWNLDVEPRDGWLRSDLLLIALLLNLIITFLTYRLVHYTQRIKDMDERISDLKHRDLITQAYTTYYLANTLLNPYTGNWAKPKESHWSLSLVRLDPAQLKEDILPGGTDRILFTVSELIARHVRERRNDMLVRYSENEFLILWNNIPPEKLRERTEHLQKRFEGIKFSDQPSLHLNINITSLAYISPEQSRYHDMIDILRQNITTDTPKKA